MKIIQITISAFLFCLLLSSCNDSIVGSGDVITDVRFLDGFTKVEAEDALDVRIIYGEEFLVEVRADDNLVDRVETTVTNGTLKLKYDSNVSLRRTTCEVFIEMPNLEFVKVQDAVDAKVLNFNNLTALEVIAEDASDLILSGQAEVLNIEVSDASDVDAFSFITDICNLQVEDASDLNIFCTTLIEGRVRDASSVRYRGYPDITATSTAASSIINAN